VKCGQCSGEVEEITVDSDGIKYDALLCMICGMVYDAQSGKSTGARFLNHASTN
jgi:hypothetical protein